MKRFNYTIILVAVIGLAFAGCIDKVQSPTAADDNTLPSLSKTTGPGAWVFKYDQTDAGFFYDPDTKLLLVIGINNIPAFLAGTGGVDVFNFTDIFLPKNDPNRRDIRKARGSSVAALVYQSDTLPSLGDVLEFLQNGTPVASGNVRYRYNNNDFYAYTQDNKNHNSYGWKVNGTLKGGDKIYKLNFVYRAVWDGVSGKQILKIQLTPINK